MSQQVNDTAITVVVADRRPSRWHTALVVRELRFLAPLENENRWTDLLAVLIATDPVAAARQLRLGNITGRQVPCAAHLLAAETPAMPAPITIKS
jgi:hypothetical protein